MKIGIIGVGHIGGTLARKLVGLGHEVRVANSKGVAGVRGFAEAISAIPADPRGAVEGADLVIVSVPFHAMAALPKDLFAGVPATVPVVDTSNYYPGMLSPHIPEVDSGMVESVWVSSQIGRPVIKAFNNLIAPTLADLGRPKGAHHRLAIAIAGDDAAGKQMVMDLVDAVGFDPVDGGTLAQSWRQEPCTPSYCCDFDADEMRKAIAAAQPGEARNKLRQLPALFASLGPNPSHAEIIAANRELAAAQA